MERQNLDSAIECIVSHKWFELPADRRKDIETLLNEVRFTLSEFLNMLNSPSVTPRTIHWYLEVGVLPEPEKIHKKRYLYDGRHLALMAMADWLNIHLTMKEIGKVFRGIHTSQLSAAELFRFSGLVNSIYPEEPIGNPATMDEEICKWMGWDLDRCYTHPHDEVLRSKLLPLWSVVQAFVGAQLLNQALGARHNQN